MNEDNLNAITDALHYASELIQAYIVDSYDLYTKIEDIIIQIESRAG